MIAKVPQGLPGRALTWAEARASHAIVDVAAIGGGITNTKWLLRLTEGAPLIIRWSDPLVWGPTGREHVRREALACRLLADSNLPVPRLVASDPDGAIAGGPANLLTWRPGRVRHERLGPAAINALAGLAVAVHRQQVKPGQRPPTFSFRGPAVPAGSGLGPLARPVAAGHRAVGGRPTAGAARHAAPRLPPWKRAVAG